MYTSQMYQGQLRNSKWDNSNCSLHMVTSVWGAVVTHGDSFPQSPGHLLWVTFCAISRVTFLTCEVKKELDQKQNLFYQRSPTQQVYSSHIFCLQRNCGWWLTVNSNEIMKNTTAATLAQSYSVCPMSSPQRITCPQHFLQQQLTFLHHQLLAKHD